MRAALALHLLIAICCQGDPRWSLSSSLALHWWVSRQPCECLRCIYQWFASIAPHQPAISLTCLLQASLPATGQVETEAFLEAHLTGR